MTPRFSLSTHGTSFATRARGEELRLDALELAGEAPDLVLDFSGVARVSYSFADEFAGKLGMLYAVTVEGANANVARHIDAAVARRTATPATC